ncbi:MAG: hypothetical protein JHC61_01315 [Burkholderiaceae bacterium]|nr:hypothetical protein [Burkholderiaceae bacterium]
MDSDLLLLPLDDSVLGQSALGMLQRYGTAWRAVLSGDPRMADSLRKDPLGFLQNLGGESGVHADSVETRTLMAFTDPEVVKASLSGDYAAFLRKLKSLHILSDGAESLMRQRVKAAIAALPSMPQDMTSIADETPEIVVRDQVIVDEFNAIMRNMIHKEYEERESWGDRDDSLVVVVAAFVYIAVGVHTYTAVTSQLAVAINVAAWVAVTTDIVVTANGNEKAYGVLPLDRSTAGQTEFNESFGTDSHHIQRKKRYALAYQAFLRKRMLVFGEERHAELAHASRLASLLGNEKFTNETNRQLVRDEVRLFLEAAHQIGTLNMPRDKLLEIISRCQKIALRAAMLD